MNINKLFIFGNIKMRYKFWIINILYLFTILILVSVFVIAIKNVYEIKSHELILSEIEKAGSELLFYEREYIDDFSEYYLSRYTMSINNMRVHYKNLKPIYKEEEKEIKFITTQINDYMVSFFSVSDFFKEYIKTQINFKDVKNLRDQTKLELSKKHNEFLSLIKNVNKKIKDRMDNNYIKMKISLTIVCIIVGIMLVIIILSTNMLANNGIIKPIERLSDKMKLFGANPTTINISKIKRKDEIGDLINFFSVMANSIVDYSENLEMKVTERTNELMIANQKLEIMNEDLTKTKDSLWGEMMLAKRIQQELLPVKPQIPGFKISAFMEPADEVGGDYYDVINEGDNSWIIIGDVSGHGVVAGLIMMMVQTSIHAILHGLPNIKPSKLIDYINYAIYYNIQKFKEDKYMTLTILHYDKSGVFTFAGLHQDILIFRKRTNTLEIIETSGFWIGFQSDIHNLLDNRTFSLESGDMMLLYTDGIIEATKKDVGDDFIMFGDAKLESLLSENGNKTPDEFKNILLENLKNYKTMDDITFFLMKKE